MSNFDTTSESEANSLSRKSASLMSVLAWHEYEQVMFVFEVPSTFETIQKPLIFSSEIWCLLHFY